MNDLTAFENISLSDQEFEQGLFEEALTKEVEEHLSEDPYHNPLDTYRHYIASVLSKITGKESSIIFPLLQSKTLDDGDLFLLVTELEIEGLTAEMLVALWVKEIPAIGLVKKPIYDFLFVRFFLNPIYLQDIIPEVLQDEKWGHNPLLGLKDEKDPSKGRKKIVVEFSSPNIAKPFHGGNFRSTIIGGFLCNLYEEAGWEVVRLNYLGDWSKQYGLLAAGFSMFGNQKKLDKNPTQHLYDVYFRTNKVLNEEQKIIDAPKDASDLAKVFKAEKVKREGVGADARLYFKDLCEGHPESIEHWDALREHSIESYKQFYARLNIKFDFYTGESTVSEESMKEVEKLMENKKLTELSEGTTIVDFTKHAPASKSLGEGLVRNRDGTGLQLMRDVGALFDREKSFAFDKMIYVVTSGRQARLQQLFKVIELTGNPDLRSRISEVKLGGILSNDTSPGMARILDEILREVAERMQDVMKNNGWKFIEGIDRGSTADSLGIASLVVQDMSGKLANCYHYNLETMTSFQGDTGAYLQYSYAQLCFIIEGFQVPSSELKLADFTLLSEELAIDLVRLIAQFPETISNTIDNQEPRTVLNYLFRLTRALNNSHITLQIMGSDELSRARLALYFAIKRVLQNGMKLLGITPIERM